MSGLVPGIHVFAGTSATKDVDGRDKPGHDGFFQTLSPHAGREARRSSAQQQDQQDDWDRDSDEPKQDGHVRFLSG
jgi:hypothetical protein